MFTLTELLENAPGGRGNNQRQIERLIEVGVLEEGARRGRQRCIRANTTYFLYDELRSIAMKSFSMREPLLKALMPFSDKITEAFVFGSIAKQTDKSRSDIDLIVVGDASIIEISEAISDLEAKLHRPIHMSLYNSEEWLDLKANDPVVAQIATGQKMMVLENNNPLC